MPPKSPTQVTSQNSWLSNQNCSPPINTINTSLQFPCLLLNLNQYTDNCTFAQKNISFGSDVLQFCCRCSYIIVHSRFMVQSNRSTAYYRSCKDREQRSCVSDMHERLRTVVPCFQLHSWTRRWSRRVPYWWQIIYIYIYFAFLFRKKESLLLVLHLDFVGIFFIFSVLHFLFNRQVFASFL